MRHSHDSGNARPYLTVHPFSPFLPSINDHFLMKRVHMTSKILSKIKFLQDFSKQNFAAYFDFKKTRFENYAFIHEISARSRMVEATVSLRERMLRHRLLALERERCGLPNSWQPKVTVARSNCNSRCLSIRNLERHDHAHECGTSCN